MSRRLRPWACMRPAAIGVSDISEVPGRGRGTWAWDLRASIPYHGRPLSEAQNPTAHLRYLAVHLCQHSSSAFARFVVHVGSRAAASRHIGLNPPRLRTKTCKKRKIDLLCGFDLHDTVLRTVYVTYPIFRRQHYAPAA